MKKPVLAGALIAGAVSLVLACSEDSTKATPGGSSGSTPDASGGGGAFCDDYGTKIDAFECVSTEAANGFAAVCKEASEKEGACRSAYEALLSCQARDSKCVGSGLEIAACAKETEAWQACKDGSPQKDGGKCTSIAADGAEITAQQEATEFPSPEAGELLKDGTYELTAAVLHTGAGGATGPVNTTTALTLRIAGAAFEIVAKIGAETSEQSGSIAVDGTTLTLQATCPKSEDSTLGFTQVDGDTLKIYEATEKTVQTLKRRP